MTKPTPDDFTLLESELYKKVKFIEKYKIQIKYIPKRIEPGIDFELNKESNWSKFVGESLFINQKILLDADLKEYIFWREAFLLFVPKSMRNIWWINLLANAFPLSINRVSYLHEKWGNLFKEQITDKFEFINKCKLIARAAGTKGIIDALKQGLYFSLQHKNINNELAHLKSDLEPHQFNIILDKIFSNSIKISENSFEIIKRCLIEQTIEPKRLKNYFFKHKSTISKTIKKLVDFNIIRQRYLINYNTIGLTQYIVLLLCLRNQILNFKEPIRNPFLFEHKFHCFNTCIITQYYVGPNTSYFFKQLENYCANLKKENKVMDYYVFESSNSYRSYLFDYFNAKTNKHEINVNDIAIESNLFVSEFIESNNKSINNIEVPGGIKSSNYREIDFYDLKIMNQFLLGNSSLKGIQRTIKKDMNDIVKRIKRLIENKVIYKNIWVILPESDGEIFLYIQDRNDTPLKFLKERIINFCHYLPYVFICDIKGTFKGYLIHSYLPYSTTIELADLFNSFLPDNVNNQIILGKPIFQKVKTNIDESRWNDGSWIVKDEDFST